MAVGFIGDLRLGQSGGALRQSHLRRDRDREWTQHQARLRGSCGSLGDLCGSRV